MSERDQTKELYEVDVLEDSNRIDNKGNLGMTDFKEKTVKIPGFGDVLRSVYFNCRSKFDEYTAIAKGLTDYIYGHEFKVEVQGRPGTEAEHSKLEKDYLVHLRDSGYTNAYRIGLALHNMRLDRGDKTGFSKRIGKYVKSMGEKYSVYDLMDKLDALLGNKPVPNEYAFAGQRC